MFAYNVMFAFRRDVSIYVHMGFIFNRRRAKGVLLILQLGFGIFPISENSPPMMLRQLKY